jgi:hypothetical protein
MINNPNKPPPPGPMVPIEDDSMTALQREMTALRAKADAATPPELRELMKSTVKSYSSSNPLPTPTVNRKANNKPIMNKIIQTDAQGRPKAPERSETPSPDKLVFPPGPDGTFVKVMDRPAPPNFPGPWTQKYIVTHTNKPFAIVQDGPAAKLVAEALNIYFIAIYANQRAADAASQDANAFDQIAAEPAAAQTEGA